MFRDNQSIVLGDDHETVKNRKIILPKHTASLRASLLNTEMGSANRMPVRTRRTCRVSLTPKYMPTCVRKFNNFKSNFDSSGKEFRVLVRFLGGSINGNRGQQFHVAA